MARNNAVATIESLESEFSEVLAKYDAEHWNNNVKAMYFDHAAKIASVLAELRHQDARIVRRKAAPTAAPDPSPTDLTILNPAVVLHHVFESLTQPNLRAPGYEQVLDSGQAYLDEPVAAGKYAGQPEHAERGWEPK